MTAEKQKLILHEMEAVRASDEEDHIPGYDKIKLWTGKSICEYLRLRQNQTVEWKENMWIFMATTKSDWRLEIAVNRPLA